MAEDMTPEQDPTALSPEEYAKLVGPEFDPLEVPQEAGIDMRAMQEQAALKRIAELNRLPSDVTGGARTHTPPYRPGDEVFAPPAPPSAPPSPDGPHSTFQVDYEVKQTPADFLLPPTTPTGTEAEVVRQQPPSEVVTSQIPPASPGVPYCPPTDVAPAKPEFVQHPEPARVHHPSPPGEQYDAIDAVHSPAPPPMPDRNATQKQIVGYLEMRMNDLDRRRKTDTYLGTNDMSALIRRMEFLRDDILPAVRGLRA